MSSREDHSTGMLKESKTESGDSHQSPQQEQDEASAHSPTIVDRIKQLWAKTGITIPVLKLMVKGALTPTIALAAYQSTAWAETYTTIGYLIGSVSSI